MTRNRTNKELRQQQKMAAAIKNLANMIDDSTKKWWTSKTIIASVLFASTSGASAYFCEGQTKQAAAGAAFAALMIGLRLVTKKAIR
jgi:hypothetical protein